MRGLSLRDVSFLGAASGVLPGITDGLLAYLPLEESAGNLRLDSGANGYDMGEAVDTVPNVAGVQGNAADIAGGGGVGYLRRFGNELVPAAGDYSVGVWVRMDSLATHDRPVFSRWGSTTAVQTFWLGYDFAADRFQVRVGDGSSQVTVDADNLGSPSSGTWYFLRAWVDDGTEVGIQVNEGTKDTAAMGFSWAISGTEPVLLGADGNGYSMDGRVDELGLWTRLISDSEASYLYNAGAGRTWPL